MKCCVVQHRRTDKLYKLKLEIILSDSHLPRRSSTLNLLSDVKPVNVLMELVLYPDFLNKASQPWEGYLKMFENLTRSPLSPPSFQMLDAVIKKIEICGPNVTPSGLAWPCSTACGR